MTTIKVNADVWADTADDDRQSIKSILVASKLIKADDEIESDPTPQPYTLTTTPRKLTTLEACK